ncbi:MAG: transcription antitermination factor NusB [Alphaproteobacteria bacterium]
MRRRSAARALAIQALYQRDLRGDQFADEQLEAFLVDSSPDAEVRAFAGELVKECRLRLDKIDETITAAATHWKIRRMSAIDRNILRLGVLELCYREDVPPKVAVDEAIRLAKRFGSAESGAFVNGVLDKVMASCQKAKADGS